MKLEHWTPSQIIKKIGRRTGYYKRLNAKKAEGHVNSVFLWIPKTAGTSITKALEKHNFLVLYNTASVAFYFPQCGGVSFAHMSYTELLKQNYITSNFDATSFKFTFVRNPYDRAVSIYEYFIRLKRIEPTFTFKQFTELMKNKEYQYVGLASDENFSHCNKQSSYLYDGNNKLIADYVGKVENIDTDFKEICDHLKINENLDHLNKSSRKNLDHYYSDDKIIKNVYEAYEEDFDNFKYTKKLR